MLLADASRAPWEQPRSHMLTVAGQLRAQKAPVQLQHYSQFDAFAEPRRNSLLRDFETCGPEKMTVLEPTGMHRMTPQRGQK